MVPTWGQPWRVEQFNRPLGQTGDVEEWVRIVHSSDVDGDREVIAVPVGSIHDMEVELFRFITSCVNALAGLNPEALPELIEAVLDVLAGDSSSMLDGVADALAKLRGEKS